MKKISDYLDKFRNIGLVEVKNRENIFLVINEIFNQEIADKCKVSFQSKTIIKIKASGAIKAEILLRKKEILDSINSKEASGRFFVDIV